MKNILLTFLALFSLSAQSKIIVLDDHTEVDIREEADNLDKDYPTIFTDKYYANKGGAVYDISANSLTLMYQMDDAVLVGTHGGKALGYETGYAAEGHPYFLCDISDCGDAAKRKYVETDTFFSRWNDFSYERSPMNNFSGYGHVMIPAKNNKTEFGHTIAITNYSGEVLDFFDVESGYASNQGTVLRATTGITKEPEFKLMSSDHETYELKLKKWNSDIKRLLDVPLLLSSGEEINSVYPQGLAPALISDPYLNAQGILVHSVAILVVYSPASDVYGNTLIWGELQFSNGIAQFIEPLKVADLKNSPEGDRHINIHPGDLTDSTFYNAKDNTLEVARKHFDLNSNGNGITSTLYFEYFGDSTTGYRYRHNERGDYLIDSMDSGVRDYKVYFKHPNQCTVQ